MDEKQPAPNREGQLFVVGQVVGESWEFEGVFDSRELAESKCLDRAFFVGPVRLNEELPQGPTAWVGAYYPNREGRTGRYVAVLRIVDHWLVWVDAAGQPHWPTREQAEVALREFRSTWPATGGCRELITESFIVELVDGV